MKRQVGLVQKCVLSVMLSSAWAIPGMQALAADQLPVKAPAAVEPIPYWWWHGEVDVGGRFFLNNPQRNGLNYLGQNSLAKFYEYRDLRPGPFGNIWLSTGSRDGLYQVDLGGKNIGWEDQYYYLDASKAGEHYFNFQWDQTPHLYSTSALTPYNVIGGNVILSPGLSTSLWNAARASNFNGPGGVQSIINANLHQTDIGIGATPRRSSIAGPRPMPGTSKLTIRACIARAPKRWAWFSTTRPVASSLKPRRL